MIKDFILPDIGEGIVECELVEWLIQEGDLIEEDQPVADVMTDKALVQIPSPFHGRVVRLFYQQGDIARIHSPLFAVELAEEQAPITQPPVVQAPAAAEQPAAQAAAEAKEEDFILPDLGEGIVECELVEWLVKEGDLIEEDQPVADVMTDKALVQIPAPRAGRVTRLYYAQGEMAKMHSPLFAIMPSYTHSTTTAAPAAAPVAAPAKKPASSIKAPAAAACQAAVPQASASRPGGKVLAGPAVRRVAREYGLDLAQVPGSGKDGRILKEDVQRYRASLEQAPKGAATAAVSTEPSVAAVATEKSVRIEPIRGIQAAMAKRMVEAVSSIPHFTYGDEVDMSALLQLRGQLKLKAEQQGVRLTLMPFIMKAMALAVQSFPILNARVNDDCTELHYLPSCNIGMAVDSKIGLLVPNVKGVERLSILDIAREVQRLTDAARTGKLRQDDLQGGTISISNIGALGGTFMVPVVNKPEVAIVALGKTQTLPRFDAAGQVVASSIMNISWSGDHRVLDGATMARFSNLWKAYLEDPASMLLELA
ncbi:dihydrolipoamide acetyltransferase [Marinobacterium aestuarii]|uniref:Dihydrolipoamide acetyltransferase component of pyruvate dehydrogenase complex n=1 Tax=Marinobacterium aestuarii TaxID=1821621 RepID=A0A1A9F454_9GAMM|nr:dihydrolipoyllysine-residue acetyltransferase [Marinobacterium aestuarii]ANG64760.1 dihydrolipoamide acetyltransferase [Marinobacterium aestuarii]